MILLAKVTVAVLLAVAMVVFGFEFIAEQVIDFQKDGGVHDLAHYNLPAMKTTVRDVFLVSLLIFIALRSNAGNLKSRGPR